MLMQEETVNKTSIPQDEQLQRNNTNISKKNRAAGLNGSVPFVRKKMIMKFAKLVGAIVGAFLLAGSIAILAINGSQNAHTPPIITLPPLPSEPANSGPENQGAASAPADTEQADSILLPPLKTNFLIVGKDVSGLLTDVIIVGCFDRQTCDISLISIPRDTLTVIPPERLKRMKDLGLYPPSDGTMKINAVNSYGRESYGMALLQEQLKDMLGIDIQYYIEIDLQAFRNIVDDLGGVYFKVPEPGMYYNDPYQDLHIAIPPGFQYLDGKNAEGLVRFRDTYRDGDLQRINVQHDFIKALFSQVLERDDIIKNAFAISKSIINYSKTNFSITDAPKYLRYINNIRPDNLFFYTLPCEPEYINKISYVIPNSDQINDLVNNIFYKISVPETTEAETEAAQPVPESEAATAPPTVISSEGLRIEILNGTGKSGTAGVFRDMLTEGGFSVAKIDTYTGAQMDKTQIIVKSEGMGYDLTHYFKDSLIQVMPDMPEEYDIIIITGLGEK